MLIFTIYITRENRKIYSLGRAIRTPVVGEIRDFPDGIKEGCRCR